MRFAIIAAVLLMPLPVIAEDNPQDVPEALPAVASVSELAGPEAIPVVTEAPTLFQARIQEHSATELYTLLSRAERIAGGLEEYRTQAPIAMVLYGEEIELFKRENYRDNKALVDLAARLDAFNIIDVKVCKDWMAQRGVEITDLPPFVDSVTAGNQEVKRLEKAGYAYF